MGWRSARRNKRKIIKFNNVERVLPYYRGEQKKKFKNICVRQPLPNPSYETPTFNCIINNIAEYIFFFFCFTIAQRIRRSFKINHPKNVYGVYLWGTPRTTIKSHTVIFFFFFACFVFWWHHKIVTVYFTFVYVYKIEYMAWLTYY